jgi:hypothetical protein
VLGDVGGPVELGNEQAAALLTVDRFGWLVHKRAASRAPAAGATLPARSVATTYRSLNVGAALR